MTFEADNLKEEDMEEFQKHLKKIMDKATMIDPKIMDESLSKLNNMSPEEIEKMNEMAQKIFGNLGNPFRTWYGRYRVRRKRFSRRNGKP